MSHNNFWPKIQHVPGATFPLGYVQLSVSTSATLGTIPTNARFALISVEGNAVRWRDDGTTPTATVGMPTAVGETLMYDGNLSALRIIAQTGTATVNVSFYS